MKYSIHYETDPRKLFDGDDQFYYKGHCHGLERFDSLDEAKSIAERHLKSQPDYVMATIFVDKENNLYWELVCWKLQESKWLRAGWNGFSETDREAYPHLSDNSPRKQNEKL